MLDRPDPAPPSPVTETLPKRFEPSHEGDHPRRIPAHTSNLLISLGYDVKGTHCDPRWFVDVRSVQLPRHSDPLSLQICPAV